MNDNERSALGRFCHCCLLWKSIITIIVDLVFRACTWHLAGSFSQAAASSGTLWNVLSPAIMQIRDSQVCTSLHSVLRLPFPICDPSAQSSGSCTWRGNRGRNQVLLRCSPAQGQGAQRSFPASPIPSEPLELSQDPHSQRLLLCLAFPSPSSPLLWPFCCSHSRKSLCKPNQQPRRFLC